MNIEKILRRTIRALQEEGQPVRIMDIAAGQGRYLFDAINDYSRIESVLMRDYSTINVEQGRLQIKERFRKTKSVLKRAMPLIPPIWRRSPRNRPSAW